MQGIRAINKEIKEVSSSEVLEWFKEINKKRKINITTQALEIINESLLDDEFNGYRFIDTAITYQDALLNERVSLEDYVNAIRFCSFLESYEGNATKAYIKTFRHREFVKSRVKSGDLSQIQASASRYRKNPLVVNILTQAEVPLYLMFQGYRYQAINKLVQEMNEAKLSKDRINAADRLLVHLKPPENLKLEVNVGIKKDNIVNEYESMLENMVKEQRKLLLSGESVLKVANARSNYIDAEVVENGKEC